MVNMLEVGIMKQFVLTHVSLKIGEEKKMMDEIILEGGNLNTVIRIGNTVRRPLKKWSSNIHKLLLHVEAQGFSAVPSFFGIDERDREILSFIPGETGVELHFSSIDFNASA